TNRRAVPAAVMTLTLHCVIDVASSPSISVEIEGNEASPPKFSASGRGRCRAADRIAACKGAGLCEAADDDGRAVLSRWPDRYDCAHHGGADADIARADHHR